MTHADPALRFAIFGKEGQTMLLPQPPEDYCEEYDIENHPVLEMVEGLFVTLTRELRKQEANQ